jgi:hypothetical protein
MELKTPIPNAFTINRLAGLGGSIPFPFGAKAYREREGVCALSLHTQAVVDLSDLFQDFETIAVFDVSHYTYDQETNREIPLANMVEIEKVECRNVDQDTVLIKGSALGELLMDFGHYDLHILDMPKDPPDDLVVVSVLKYHEYQRGETYLLQELPDSRVFLDSHDDCYLYLESRDLRFLKKAFSRMLQIYVGTVLFEEVGFEGEITEVPKNVLEFLWPEGSGMTILRDRANIKGTQLRIGVSQQGFSFGEKREYPISLFIEYDASVGEWLVPVSLPPNTA